MSIGTFIVDEVTRRGYLIVAGTVGAESAGLPVPGETAMLVASFLARQGHLDLRLVIASAAGAAIVGDNIGYAIGRRYGRGILERHGRWFLLPRDRLDAGEEFFERHGGKAVFLARWSAGLRVAGAWLAGVSRMKWWRFLLWNALGAIAWATAVCVAGYALGSGYAAAERAFGVIGIALFALLVIGFITVHLLRHRRERAD